MGHIGNRPLLRCIRGYSQGLRLTQFEAAERVFDQMLWLNPSEDQGVRLLIDEVRVKTGGEDCREEL